MNYRHAYHAGNMADCHKHAVLVWLLRALARKEKPFLVLDTHAGLGRYDLSAEAALRTGEAARGILRLLEQTPAPLADYVGLVCALGLYPGSPALAAALLRPADRLVACELHPEDHAALRRTMRGDPRVAVHLRDGYEAVAAFLPPPERRGLTLIDPPYEAADEQGRLLAALRTAHARFPGGTVAAWYPIKHRAPVRALHDALAAAGLPDVVATELCLRAPLDAARLNGSGLLVVNPPYRFEDEVRPIMHALLARLGDREAGEGAAVIRIAAERSGTEPAQPGRINAGDREAQGDQAARGCPAKGQHKKTAEQRGSGRTAGQSGRGRVAALERTGAAKRSGDDGQAAHPAGHLNPATSGERPSSNHEGRREDALRDAGLGVGHDE